ncbi:MAG TPA: hypothetical protein VGR26_03515 [Acidimicrobiales bacterium]|nr:hypothetical protein [Acidimicrobiales bacterium]
MWTRTRWTTPVCRGRSSTRQSIRAKVVAGAFVIAGRGPAVAVAEVVDVDVAGVLHLRDVGGTVEVYLHLVWQGRPVP